ncbi:hypothetical protein [Pseudomonas sp. Teo4]|uniref:hypothetical protein n=1 Tax=Pseudomonas sp. Teo4 TaxID=3064528 RepID=UPI002AB99F62|nr:hypothetical protein [Pseudomonas sp. Teo4]MDZ3992081.1 hypothetical protein [Pseudomonas sp. Teo4]
MPEVNKPALALIFLLFSAVCAADDDITRESVRLIKADFPAGCVVRLDQYLSSVGTNGVMGGAWLVQTCQGSFEYGSRYFPAAVHADGQRVRVTRNRKLDAMTPEQLKRSYSLKE